MPLFEEKLSWLVKYGLNWYHHFLINILKAGPIPRHVAFIMDGNRRYARKSNVPLHMGHSRGFEKLSQIIYWCNVFGIQEITVYAFSIENFSRSPEEVETLMKLVIEKIDLLLTEIEDINQNGLCIRVIGNLSLVSNTLKTRMAKAVLLTKHNTKLVLNVAFPYTSQDEMMHSFEEIRQGLLSNKIEENDITEELITKCMYSSKSRELDVLIRTSGEVRFSDFLLWQSYNTNVVFPKVLWPDLSIYQFMWCIFSYQRHYSHQKQVKTLLSHEEFIMEERINDFLQELEEKRFNDLETYASL